MPEQNAEPERKKGGGESERQKGEKVDFRKYPGLKSLHLAEKILDSRYAIRKRLYPKYLCVQEKSGAFC